MQQTKNTGQRGSARFATQEDFGTFDNKVNFAQHFVIGKSLPEVNSQQTQDIIVKAPAHNLLFGGSGSGKSLWLMQNILARSMSFCVIDIKAEIYHSVSPFLQAKGFNIIRLDPFDVWETKYRGKNGHSETAHSYNPLEKFDPLNPHYRDDIAGLAEAIIPLTVNESPHWPITARTLLEGLLSYVVETQSEPKTLGRVRELFCGGLLFLINLAETVVKNENREYGDHSLTQRKLTRLLGLTPDNRELTSVYSTADAHLKFLDSDIVSECLSESDFHFEDLLNLEKKTAIFIILPENKIKSHNKVLRLMVSEVINVFANNGGNSEFPVDLLIDEAATVGHLSSLPMAYSYMRGEGLRLTCIYQSVAQLEKQYQEESEVFFDNSSSIIILKATSLKSAEYFSKMLGNTTISEQHGKEVPQSIGDFPYILQNKFLLHNNAYNNDTSGHTGMTYSRPLMTPDEIMQLPEDLGIIITNGRPAVFRKIKTYKEKPYCDALRPKPIHTTKE